MTHGVDTGFLVFNERTYPQLIALFAELGVDTAPSEMSFSVQSAGRREAARTLEWSGTNLSTVFCPAPQPAQPALFAHAAPTCCASTPSPPASPRRSEEAALMQPLGEFLSTHRFGAAFRDWYFLPMLGCIWSCPTDQMLKFPVATMMRFCHNHGLLQVSNRPQWWTVRGGATPLCGQNRGADCRQTPEHPRATHRARRGRRARHDRRGHRAL